MSADIVVVGSGLAGYCATLEAADCGAQVLLLEKQTETGGTSVISGGAIAFAGTDAQRLRQIDDSPQRLFADLRRVGGGSADERLLEAFISEQSATWRWLEDRGVRFGSVQQGSGQSVPRSNRVDAAQMMQALAERAAKHPRITLRIGCAARQLVRAPGYGRVAGIITGDADRQDAAQARSAVIVCCGGFSRDDALILRHAPELVQAQRAGAPGCTGDGLRLAGELGAALKDMDTISSTFGRHPDSRPEENGLLHPVYKGAIAVNRAALRFVDESQSYKVLGEACLRQPDALAFQIFDRDIMALSVPEAATSNFAGALASGRVLEADSLQELARRLGLDASALEKTVFRYNADATRGRDSCFGRSSLANGNGSLRAIVKPPYYAYACTSAILGTYCGLAVDATGRVLDDQGKPIIGLFAAGEMTGGFHGHDYMTGSSLAKAAVFGRIAGRTAAAG